MIENVVALGTKTTITDEKPVHFDTTKDLIIVKDQDTVNPVIAISHHPSDKTLHEIHHPTATILPANPDD